MTRHAGSSGGWRRSLPNTCSRFRLEVSNLPADSDPLSEIAGSSHRVGIRQTRRAGHGHGPFARAFFSSCFSPS